MVHMEENRDPSPVGLMEPGEGGSGPPEMDLIPGHALQKQCSPFLILLYTDATCQPQPSQLLFLQTEHITS